MQIMDKTTGNVIDLPTLQSMVSKSCMFFCNPAPMALEGGGGGTVIAGMEPGVKAFPITLSELTADGAIFFVTGDYPARITFVHCITGATCNIDFLMIPPHAHDRLTTGGPAYASYNSFQP